MPSSFNHRSGGHLYLCSLSFIYMRWPAYWFLEDFVILCWSSSLIYAYSSSSTLITCLASDALSPMCAFRFQCLRVYYVITDISLTYSPLDMDKIRRLHITGADMDLFLASLTFPRTALCLPTRQHLAGLWAVPCLSVWSGLGCGRYVIPVCWIYPAGLQPPLGCSRHMPLADASALTSVWPRGDPFSHYLARLCC